MINILTLKVDTKYSAEYVNRLYNSIKRNTTAEFKFYCYTENPVDLLPEICIIPIEHPNKFKLQWHKLIFHKTGFANIPIGQKCLILDIDWVILNNIDCILQYDLPSNHLGCFERWWSNRRNWCKLNGGFQMFYMGETNYLWEEFIKNPEHWQDYFIRIGEAVGPVNGEQNFIDKHTINKEWLPMKWFAKYVSEALEPGTMAKLQTNWHTDVNNRDPFYLAGEFAESIKMVHFSDAYNLIHLNNTQEDDWINDVWI